MKKRLLLGGFLGALFIAGTLSGSASAVVDETNNTPVRDGEMRMTQVEERGEARTQRVLARCNLIQQRLTAHIGRTNDAVERTVIAYDRLNARLTGVIAYANEVGYDATDLQAGYNDITDQIATMSDNATSVTDGLSLAASEACTEDPAAYGQALRESRQALQSLRQESVAIRATFVTQVIPALQEFKAWLEVNQT